jgi:hypothetical protein
MEERRVSVDGASHRTLIRATDDNFVDSRERVTRRRCARPFTVERQVQERYACGRSAPLCVAHVSDGAFWRPMHGAHITVFHG